MASIASSAPPGVNEASRVPFTSLFDILIPLLLRGPIREIAESMNDGVLPGIPRDESRPRQSWQLLAIYVRNKPTAPFSLGDTCACGWLPQLLNTLSATAGSYSAPLVFCTPHGRAGT